METGDRGVVADDVRVAILIVVRSLYICFFLEGGGGGASDSGGGGGGGRVLVVAVA